MNPVSHSRRGQRGGFVIGVIVGLLVGLSVALGVALYVTKAPNPFVNKVPTRPAGQDAADAERNRNWDPNTGLAGRNPAPTSSTPATLPATGLPPPAVPTSPPPTTAAAPADAASPARSPRVAASSAPAATTLSTSPAATGDPFLYFVQAGAYARTEDAEQQRAKLAMIGLESKLTEREQGGRTVYRVRVGPFDRKEDADSTKEKLSDAGVDAALVRVQK